MTKFSSVQKTLRTAMRTQTMKQSTITLTGTFLNGIIGVIFYIWVARMLGPYDYGIFSFITVTVALLASIANAGTDTGITRFVAESWDKNKNRSLRFMKAGLLLKLIGWFITLGIGILFSEQITQFLLQKQELSRPLQIAVIGVGGSMLFSFGCAALQALQRFFSWSFVNVLGNSLRLLMLLFLVSLGVSAASVSVWLFIGIPFAAFLISLLLLPSFWQARVQKSELRELFHFNKWVAATTIIVAISTRLDSLFATRYLTLTEVGYYSVAVSLSGFISQIVLALGTVAAPKFATFTSRSQAKRYFMKFELLVVILSLIGVPAGIIIAHVFVPLLYGDSFVPSIAPLAVLIASYALFLVAMPIHTVILYFEGNSRFFFFLGIAHLVTTLVAGALLIPLYGMMGAAYTVGIGMIINLLVPTLYVVKKLL